MSQAESYREYHQAVRPPKADLNDIHCIASTVRLFWLRTRHSLDAVLSPGFFDDVADLRLKAEDRIEVVAGDGPAEHATLAVDHVNKHGGDVRVSLLLRYKRAD